MNVHAVLLAAGSSQRFGGIKQLAELNKLTLLEHAISTYCDKGGLIKELSGMTVVLGAHEKIIRANIPHKVNFFIAPNWHSGMGHSLADFVQSLSPRVSHLLVGLGDQVLLQKEDIQVLIQLSTQCPDAIVSARYNSIVGAPSIFPRAYFNELALLQGDKGAKRLIVRHSAKVKAVDLPNAQFDIDTPQDLQFIASHAKFQL